MHKTWWTGISVLALSIGTALAEGEAPAAAPAEAKKEAAAPAEVKKEVSARMAKPELQDINATGMIEKTTNKKGETVYFLAAEDGTRIMLKGKNLPDCSALVGSKVKIAGKGLVMEKKGKKQCVIRSVSSLEKVEQQPAAN